MAIHEIVDLPSIETLNNMKTTKIEALSAKLTSIKDAFLAEYKQKQEQLQSLLTRKLRTEQDERIKNDPKYWQKHQGIGGKLPQNR